MVLHYEQLQKGNSNLNESRGSSLINYCQHTVKQAECMQELTSSTCQLGRNLLTLRKILASSNLMREPDSIGVVNNLSHGELSFAVIGRADIEGSEGEFELLSTFTDSYSYLIWH